MVAKLFSKRHKQYQHFVRRVQTFILNMKKEEAHMRQRKQSEKDPFESQKVDKQIVAIKLEYANPEKEKIAKLTLRPPRRSHAKNDKEHDEWKKVRNFLSHTSCSTERDDSGESGVTWLELYMWYAMHAEKPTRAKGKKLLEPKVTLLKKIAEFKAAVRKVMVFCCDIQDEQLFRTCPSRQNRLIDLAIANKQSAVQGRPYIPENEAKAIAADILS